LPRGRLPRDPDRKVDRDYARLGVEEVRELQRGSSTRAAVVPEFDRDTTAVIPIYAEHGSGQRLRRHAGVNDRFHVR
jgi:hypothetical protein